MIYRNFLKRGMDVFLAFLMFVLLLPFFVILVLILSVQYKGSPFFSQSRPGLGGVSFQILKFKTMTDKRDGRGDLLTDAERINSFGKLVRKTSLDEIPQLLNVLKGDMSMIGPRPLLVDYLELYSETQARRHEVRPGVTGWAQVNGRNAISWQKKFALDVWYVDNMTFLLDLRILFLTVYKVLTGGGVSAQGQISVEKFTGNPENID